METHTEKGEGMRGEGESVIAGKKARSSRARERDEGSDRN